MSNLLSFTTLKTPKTYSISVSSTSFTIKIRAKCFYSLVDFDKVADLNWPQSHQDPFYCERYAYKWKAIEKSHDNSLQIQRGKHVDGEITGEEEREIFTPDFASIIAAPKFMRSMQYRLRYVLNASALVASLSDYQMEISVHDLAPNTTYAVWPTLFYVGGYTWEPAKPYIINTK